MLTRGQHGAQTCTACWAFRPGISTWPQRCVRGLGFTASEMDHCTEPESFNARKLQKLLDALTRCLSAVTVDMQTTPSLSALIKISLCQMYHSFDIDFYQKYRFASTSVECCRNQILCGIEGGSAHQAGTAMTASGTRPPSAADTPSFCAYASRLACSPPAGDPQKQQSRSQLERKPNVSYTYCKALERWHTAEIAASGSANNRAHCARYSPSQRGTRNCADSAPDREAPRAWDGCGEP